jgi:hypothetical protein
MDFLQGEFVTDIIQSEEKVIELWEQSRSEM